MRVTAPSGSNPTVSGVANGGDESAWVAVQIESKSGTCDPTVEWTLAVEGDK